MKVIAHNKPSELFKLARLKKYAEISDRIKAVAQALLGETNETVAEIIDRPCSFVGRWVQRYNKGGIKALFDISKPGHPKNLKTSDEERFIERILAGSKKKDGVVRLTGKTIIKILKSEFGVTYSLSGVYKLLHRHGLSWLRPRPIHPLNDKERMEGWKKALPPLSKRSKRSIQTKKSKFGSKTNRVSVSKEGLSQSGQKRIPDRKS